MGATKRMATAAAALVLAATAGACHPARFGFGRPRDDRPMSVDARLDCPERQGDLTRVDQAADGRSCRYAGEDDDGEEVTLSLLDLGGRSAADALASTAASLHALVPAAVAGSPEDAKAVAAAKATGRTDDDDGDDDDSKDDGAGKASIGDNRTAAAEWKADTPQPAKRSGRSHDHVAINLPGVHLEADDGGARVQAFGQNVVADDSGAQVDGSWNNVMSHVHADEGGVEIHSGWTGRYALEQGYLLSSDTAGPDGAHLAGYLARGPVAGPLVLAVVKARKGDNHAEIDDERLRDVRRLVRRNTRFD